MWRIIRFFLALWSFIASLFWFIGGDDDDNYPDSFVITPHHEVASTEAGWLVVDLKDGSSEQDLIEAENLLGEDLSWVRSDFTDNAMATGHVSNMAHAIALLKSQDNDIESVEPLMEYQALGIGTGQPDDPRYNEQWHLKAMGAPTGWAKTPRGKGVIVAVIDTGVTVTEDLKQTKVLKGKSFADGESPKDGNGHGTHVAGTIAQSTDNGVGVAGVAPEATILPVKVLSDQGYGSNAWIASGIDWAVANGADVINMSLGGPYSEVVENACIKAHKAGVIVVAATGNSGREGVSYPGAAKGVIGVSSFGPTGELAPYSSFGEGTDISAPGGDKTKPGGGVLQNTILNGKDVYEFFQGTSMASPHVAGAAAVLLSTGLTAEQTEQRILASGGNKTWDKHFGYGRLDLAKALGTNFHRNGVMFGYSLLLTALICWFAGTSRRFTLRAGLMAAVISGGFWFLGYLPFHLPGIGIFGMPAVEWLGAVFNRPNLTHYAMMVYVFALSVVDYGKVNYKARPWIMGTMIGLNIYLLCGLAQAITMTSMIEFVVTSFLTLAIAGLERKENKYGHV